MNDPARRSFLITTFEGGGSVSPNLVVAQKLLARGHHVRIMSDPCNRPEVEATGATFIPWRRAPGKATRSRETDLIKDWAADNPLEGILQAFQDVMVGPALTYAQDVMEELASSPADLVVANELLFGVHLGCEAAGQRMALLACNISLFPLEGIPPLGPGFRPAATAQEQATQDAVAALAKETFDRCLPALNGARAALGLPPVETLADQHKAAERLLLATARAFDFAPQTLPQGVDYVGPQLAEPVWAEAFESPFRRDGRRLTALVAFSTTFQNHARNLQRVIDAIAALPLDAVVTLGGSLYAHELRGAPNVTILPSAPHGEVLKEADIVVTHGGHGTVMKALVAGRPLLVMPHGRDQNDNGARVEARGAGLVIPGDARILQIRSALLRIMDEPAFAAAARDLGARIAREAQESPVAAILEDMAGRGNGPCAAHSLRAA